ncbi:MAG: PEGA domain-containing protein [Anaerocolumna sp.]
MDDKKKKYGEHKKNIKGLVPFLLFGAFFIILIAMALSVTAGNPSKETNSGHIVQSGDTSDEKEISVPVLAVLKEVDMGSGTMTLLDTESGQDIILEYTGGTNIIDKYEKVIADSQLNPGEMVDAYYDRDTSVLTKLQISNKAWEYKGVTKWSMDDTQGSFSIVDSKYKYSMDLVIVKDGKLLNMKDLDPEDELIVKGYNREAWSILVTKGHGSIRFEDYADFIGGMVYIGNKEILPVISDMSVTIQEGNYKITMEKGSLKGTKHLEVLPFEEAVLNMGEFKLPPVLKGRVKFEIIPDGADLYIDDELADYGKAIDLKYGEHTLKVALGGYTTYSGKLDIEEPAKTVSINLVESENAGNNADSENQNTQENPANNENSSTKDNSAAEDDTKDGSSENNNPNYEEVKAEENIYIQEPEGANAYFDGQFKGTVPISFPKETGTHYITLIQTGHQTKTYTVEIKDDGEDVKYNFPDTD